MRRAGRALFACLLPLLAESCRHPASPSLAAPITRAERFTCCNLHYEGEEISDANYWLGKNLPAGTPVAIEALADGSVRFSAGDVKLTLKPEYGTKEETLQQYVDKVLVVDDPKPRIAAYPTAVRRAIANAKVERGMTREQTIVSLGYPPTHRTASTRERQWTYWWSRWLTYKVVFDDAAKLADIVGRPAPTAEVPIPNADAPSRPPANGGQKK